MHRNNFLTLRNTEESFAIIVLYKSNIVKSDEHVFVVYKLPLVQPRRDCNIHEKLFIILYVLLLQLLKEIVNCTHKIVQLYAI